MKNTPSQVMTKDSVLLIPDKEGNEKYPGDIQPGYYNKHQLAALVVQHGYDHDALQFIADMLETGNPEHDQFVNNLRIVIGNPRALDSFIRTMRKET